MRILIAISVEYNYVINQLYITSAFLNGKLDEEIYLEVLELLEYSLQYVIEKDEKEIKKKATENKRKQKESSNKYEVKIKRVAN